MTGRRYLPATMADAGAGAGLPPGTRIKDFRSAIRRERYYSPPPLVLFLRAPDRRESDALSLFSETVAGNQIQEAQERGGPQANRNTARNLSRLEVGGTTPPEHHPVGG